MIACSVLWSVAVIGLGSPRSVASPGGIAFRSSSKGSGSKLKMSAPKGSAPGDLLVAGIAKHENIGPHMKAPSGWRQVIDVRQSSDTELAVYTKVLGDGEPDDYVWGTGDPDANGVILSYSRVDTEDPVLSVKSARSTGVQREISVPSLKVPVAGAMLVMFAMVEGPASNPIAPPSGFSERAERAVHPTIEAADMLLAAPGTTGKKAAKAKYPGNHIAILLALAPAGSSSSDTPSDPAKPSDPADPPSSPARQP